MPRKKGRVVVVLALVAGLFFLPKTFKRSLHGSKLPELHLAVIADAQRLDYALQVARSANHFTTSHRVHTHFVVPRLHFDQLEADARHLPGPISLHDYDYCLNLATTLRPYSDPGIHTSALCKIFLDHILPVDRVLYMDTDAVVAADLGTCYRPPTSADTLYSMAVDMGDTCQHFPRRCWPPALAYRVPEGFVCGNLPERYAPSVYKDHGAHCPQPSDEEPAFLNGGVVLYELGKMRAQNFTDRFLASVTATFAEQDQRRAQWGDQEFLNNFARYQPQSVSVLHCGCNYQWMGFRKEAKCGMQPVTIAHGWGHGVERLTNNAYNRLFHYFLHNPESRASPPTMPALSDSLPLSPNLSAPLHLNKANLRV